MEPALNTESIDFLTKAVENNTPLLGSRTGFKGASGFDWLWCKLTPGYQTRQAMRIAKLAEEQLSLRGPAGHQEATLRLINALITHHKGNRELSSTLKRIDFAAAPLRKQMDENLETPCMMPQLVKQFQKWIRYGWDPQLFTRNQSFIEFGFKSGLFSQMKITRDKPEERDGELKIKVNGSWLSATEVMDRFSFEHSDFYDEPLICEKTTGDIYTYLDTGRGLVKHHPYRDFNNPISNLSKDEFNRTLENGREFVRESDKELSEEELEKARAERTHVIQIVSTYNDSPGNWFTNNFKETILNPKHPYARPIAPTDDGGDVFETGFSYRNMYMPLANLKGHFRSPDLANYDNSSERILTNVAVTEEEFNRYQEYVTRQINKIHNFGKEVVFHIIFQNCTKFLASSLEYATGIKLPVERQVKQVAEACLPEPIRLFFTSIGSAIKKSGDFLARHLPKCIHAPIHGLAWLIGKIWDGFQSFVISTLSFLLGAGFGTHGTELSADDHERKIDPILSNPLHWFTIGTKVSCVPACLVAFQRDQPSTVVNDNPTKLNIAPPARD